MSAEILRQITIKNSGLTVESIKSSLVKTEASKAKTKNDKGEEIEVEVPATYHDKVDILKVAGIVTKTKPDKTTLGEYVRMYGQFMAINMLTGEQFSAGACILPDQVSGPVDAMLSDSSTNEVQFAVMVTAKHAPTSVTGYQFGIRPLIETKPTDAMSALLGASGMAPAPQQLEAPKSDKPAEAPEVPPIADKSVPLAEAPAKSGKKHPATA